MFYPTVQETIVIDPLLSKNFSGHVEKPPPCNGRFKNLERNPNFFILLRGFGSAMSSFFAVMRGSLFTFYSSVLGVVKCCNSCIRVE